MDAPRRVPRVREVRRAYVTDESGQQVRRPALDLDRTHAAARCLRCGAVWRGEGQLRSLARVLEES